MWKVIIALTLGYIHQLHVSKMLENDRHFSHLSTLEREMSFRTEMGLYYSYFKTVIEAPSFFGGVESLYNNNITEYPDTINTLQRFNLYPEIILGAIYRIHESVSIRMNWKTKDCWQINRGENLSPVWSCVGIGDPAYFYLNGVWVCAAITVASIFLLSTELSDSIVGGLLAVLCYFYNHGECTRVQWTPPLRESFAYPLAVAQMYLVTYIMRRGISFGSYGQVVLLSVLTMLYMVFWQFAQFSLFTQICSLFPVFAVGFMSKDIFNIILGGQMLGLLAALILLFFNKMLLTSWFCCSLLSSIAVLHAKEIPQIVKEIVARRSIVVPKFVLPNPEEERIPNQIGFSQLLHGFFKLVHFLFLTVIFKISAARILNVTDDDHIFNLLRSKFSSYRDFHTMLYTCAKEFDFLGTEMPYKCSLTLLVPSVALVALVLLWNTIDRIRHYNPENPPKSSDPEESATLLDSAVVYNLFQLLAYAAMAIMIMRLKLFLTPQLCVMVSMLGNKKFLPIVRDNPNWHTAFVVGLVACMSVQGITNINQQRNIIGEYSNTDFEELIEWINATVPLKASFAGPMPVMANVLLSTRRPVINHPHYEDEGIRARTKKIYQMYSRRTPEEYYRTLQKLKANYLVISKGWCYNIHMENDCGMTDLYDIEEPKRIGSHDPLCPILFDGRQAIQPFQQVFKNNEYVVLKLPDTVVQLETKKKSS